MLAYASAMALATGMEAMVSAAIWGVGTAVTVFIGRRKFGWGNL
jgi:Na+-driven multidrug efflux pump